MGERRSKENRRRRRRRKPKRRGERSPATARTEQESAVTESPSTGGENEIWIYTYTRYKRDKYR